MRTNTTALTLTAPELALANLEAAAEKFNTATEHLTAGTKAVLMLAGAPLIGLAFVIALPILSVVLTAYYGGKLLVAHWAGVANYVKNVALFFAAPFVGLAYIIALPFVGLGTLVYIAVKAARK
ncbi:MAG: hypothetical protein HY661_11850 [Betaproteobacteria bacterium]|nr:hypothetical protein [Betaproteobacteria bacterium]